MNFSEQEILELAPFFARRFPDDIERQRLTKAAKVPFVSGPTPLEAWAATLGTAQERRRLPELAAIAMQADSTDDNLQEVCTILTAPIQRRRVRVAIGSGVAAALVLLGVVSWSSSEPASVQPLLSMRAPEAPVEPDAVLVSTAAMPRPQHTARPAAVAAPVESAPAEATTAEATSAAATSAEAATAEAATAATAEATATSGAPRAPAAAPEAAAAYTGCRAPAGTLVGYWYAGAEAPGAAGQTITMPITVNVRADYPDAHSHFNSRAPIRCVLNAGEQITLSAAPIAVPGDRYWVPLHGGDLP